MIHVDNNMTIKDIFLDKWLVLVFNNDDHGTKTGTSRYDHWFFQIGNDGLSRMNSILYLQKSMLKKLLIMDGFGPVHFGWISCVLVHPSRHAGPGRPTGLDGPRAAGCPGLHRL